MKGILRTKYRHFSELWNTFFFNCETQVSHIAGRFFTAEPPGKPIANYHIENIILATSNTELAFPSSMDAK